MVCSSFEEYMESGFGKEARRHLGSSLITFTVYIMESAFVSLVANHGACKLPSLKDFVKI